MSHEATCLYNIYCNPNKCECAVLQYKMKNRNEMFNIYFLKKNELKFIKKNICDIMKTSQEPHELQKWKMYTVY